MLRITLIEFFGRGIWEALLFLLNVLLICKAKPDKIKLGIFTLILAVITYLIRLLPISYGVHTMIILVVLNIIVVSIFKVRAENSIKATIIVTCVLFACEGINALIVRLIYGEAFLTILKDPVMKVVYFIPSIIMLAVFSFIIYLFINKKKEDVDDTEVIRANSEEALTGDKRG